jgi:DNA mismatch repair protein MutS2
MEPHSLERLEFFRLLELVSGHCQSQPGRDRLLALRPQRDPAQIIAGHDLCRDAMALTVAGLELPGLCFDDLTSLFKRLDVEGTVLSGEELRHLLPQLDAAANLAAALRTDETAPYTALRELAARLIPVHDLANRIRSSIDVDGTLLDTASPLLCQLRHRIRSLSGQIHTRLEALLRDQAAGGVIQESFVAERNGRLVVPVRREEKAQMPGVVHDLSNSGRTMFVEPMATLPMGNELADSRLQERDECRRILAELSRMARTRLDSLRHNQQVLAEADAGLGTARWAVDYHAALPEFGEALTLVNARHPLLDHQFRNQPGRVLIPLRFAVPAGTSTVAITGSNTGGKTACLKTVGLLSLAAQAGLPVTADPESRFIIFDGIFADIGDEQSLEANLSTFSAHVETLKRFLAKSRRGRCLILLDEMGAGTDPVEGGALACATLQELAARPGCLVLATTHLGAVKLFVHNKPGMINAAVRFNEATLAPEYALDIGRPGASHALQIAHRLGMPESLLQNARAFLSHDQLRLEEVLLGMEKERREAATAREATEREQAQAARHRQDLQDELEKVRRDRRALLHDAYGQAATIIGEARREVEHLRQGIGAPGQAPAGDRREALGAATASLQARSAAVEAGLAKTKPRPPQPLQPRQIEVGKRVWIDKLKADARVISLSEDKKTAVVDLDGLRFSVKTAEIGRPQEPEPPKGPKPVQVMMPRGGEAKSEINLVGKRIDDALPVLATFISDAAVAGLAEVRIIHGFGTGRLRDAVHEWLRSQKMVGDFYLGLSGRDPGGAGVTIAILARGETP